MVGLGEGSVSVDYECDCVGGDGDCFCGVGEQVDDVGGGGVLSVHGFSFCSLLLLCL